MSFSFPNNPSINDQSTQNGRTYIWTGYSWEIASNFSLAPSISGGSYINVNTGINNYVISATGLQPSGNYSVVDHTHVSSNITDFNPSVSGLLPSVSGSGYAATSFSHNVYTISVTGLQPSGNYSVVGHTHVSSNITDFNTSVSGLLSVKNISAGSGILVSSNSGIYTISSSGIDSITIANPSNNRILTSDGTSNGIVAESGLFFDNTDGRLFTNGRMNIEQTTIQRLDSDPLNGKTSAFNIYIEPSGLLGNPDNTHNIYGVFNSVNPRAPNSNHRVNYYGTLGLVYSEIPSGVANSGSLIGLSSTTFRNNRGSNVEGWYDDEGSLSAIYGISVNYGHSIGQSGVYGPAPTGVNPYTENAYGLVVAVGKGYGLINNAYDLFLANSNFNTGTINNHYGIYQASNNPNIFAGSISVDNGLSAPTKIYNLGAVSGNTSISYSIDKQIQKLTLNGTAVNFIEGTGWDIADKSVDVMLQIKVNSTTTVAFDSNFVTDWYSTLPTFSSGTYLVLLRSMGTGVVQGHYIGNKL
ncbi:hypothetical protein EBZ38_14025 [bacterium]|nr:hypothetical protein [bacterium]